MIATRSDSIRTQAKIVSTAERLFAERGIDAVSLSEINRAAEQGNKSAVHYHFGSKLGVFEAIRAKHVSRMDAMRLPMMAPLGPTPDIESLLSVTVVTLAGRLDDPDGGPYFLRLMAQALVHPNIHVVSRLVGTEASETQTQLLGLMRQAVPDVPEVLWPLRLRLAACLLYEALGARAIEEQNGQAAGSRELFIADLADSNLAVLTSAPSPHTRAALADLELRSA